MPEAPDLRSPEAKFIDAEIARGVTRERERCAAIVQAAREGEIDGDLRSIIHRIKNPS